MKDQIKLEKPEAGQTATIATPKETNLVLGFTPEEATLVREDGNLIFTFTDGSKIVMASFYATVTKETLPDFIIGEQSFSGADFFASLVEDLMPAAGPATATGGGRFYDDTVADLMGGTTALGAVAPLASAGTQVSTETSFVVTAAGGFGDAAGNTSNEVTSTESWRLVDVSDYSIVEGLAATTIYDPVLIGHNFSSAATVSLSFADSTIAMGSLEIRANGDLYFVPDATKLNTLAPGEILTNQMSILLNGTPLTTVNLTYTGTNTNADDFSIKDTFTGTGTNTFVNTSTGHEYTLEAGNIELGLENDKVSLGSMSGGSVYGDASTMADSSQGGADNITVDSMSGGKVVGDGDTLSDTAIGGVDLIHIGTMTGGTVYGDASTMYGSSQGGADNITVDSMSGSKVVGDADTLSDTAIGGVDLIHIGTMTDGTVYGDASTMSGFSTGGNDSITVDTISGSSVYGDAYAVADSSTNGNDMISIGTMAAKTYVYGDAHSLTGSAKGGNDNITVSTMAIDTHVYGDAHVLQDVAHGGSDTITIGTMENGGRVYGDADTMSGSTTGGTDKINVDTMAAGFVHGDARYMYGSAQGGADTIKVINMSGGSVEGDADTMYASSTGGADNITITTITASGAKVYGDAHTMYDTARGGADTIKVTSMSGGDVFGDAVNMSGSTAGGADLIHIGTMNAGLVSGDAHTLSVKAQGGADLIHIGTMTGGAVYGDAASMAGSSTGGADLIHIGTMSGGTVYGDARYDARTTNAGQGGSDVIIVDAFGTGAVTVDGGGGSDMFIYNNTANQAITLANSGTVTIAGQTGKTIINFEGIGGGSGNDTLTGNANANFLRGGLGDDVLTGGGGNDVFIWARTDFGGHDVITDFTNGDKLYLNGLGLADAGVSYSIIGGNGVITIAGTVLGQTQTITLSGYTGTPDILSTAEFTTGGGNLNMLSSTVGDVSSTSERMLFEGLGHDALSADSGSDLLFYKGGDGYLFGEGGNDALFGGAGSKAFNGGEGNSILVHSADNTVLDGSDLSVAPDYVDTDIDYLVGLNNSLLNGLDVNGTLNLDDLLTNHAGIKNIEVLVFNGSDDSQGINGMTDLTAMGVATADGALNLTAADNVSWTATDQTVTLNSQEYTVFDYNPPSGGDPMQIAVLKAIVENS